MLTQFSFCGITHCCMNYLYNIPFFLEKKIILDNIAQIQIIYQEYICHNDLSFSSYFFNVAK